MECMNSEYYSKADIRELALPNLKHIWTAEASWDERFKRIEPTLRQDKTLKESVPLWIWDNPFANAQYRALVIRPP